MMMIRSMSPHVMAVDEIGRLADTQALLDAIHAGIRVIATAHGRDVLSVKSRPALTGLFESQVFARYVVLGATHERQMGGQATVYDGDNRRLAVVPWRIRSGSEVPGKAASAASIGRRE